MSGKAFDIDNEYKMKICLADNNIVECRPGQNMNTIFIGTPGCGKTFSNITSTLLCNTDGSSIVDDKKGNLYKMYSNYLMNKGFRVMRFDLVNFSEGVKYNMFESKETKEEFMALAEFMIPLDPNCRDRFFVDTARQLLVSLIGVGKAVFGEARFNLRSLFTLMSSISTGNDKLTNDEIEKFLKMVPARNKYAGYCDEYRVLRESAPKTWKSIVVVLKAALNRFNTPELFKITEKTNIDFRGFGVEKTVLFITNSDVDDAFAPLVQLLYADIVDSLIKFADTECDFRDNLLPKHVTFIVDDFASGTRQEGIENIVANCRSRNMSYIMAIQSISQLRGLYGDTSNTIMDCNEYKVFYGTSNIDTADLMSDLSAKPATEIFQMSKEDVLVIKRCHRPRMAKRFKTAEMPEYIEATSLGINR